MKLTENLAKNIKRYRHDAHLNVEEFACQLSIGRSSLADIERNAANPTLKVVEQIGQKLNTDPVLLLCSPDDQFEKNVEKLLCDTLSLFSSLPPVQRKKAAQLFHELLAILL